MANVGRPRKILDENDFWRRVDIRDKHQCWHWKGAITKAGRGQVSWQGQTRTASRVAVHLSGKLHDLSSPIAVTMKCGNLACCNPLHSHLGPIDRPAARAAAARKGWRLRRVMTYERQPHTYTPSTPEAAARLKAGRQTKRDLKYTEEFFWSLTDRDDPPNPDNCWRWLGAVSPKGYGRIHWSGKTQQATRLAMIFSGRMTVWNEGLYVIPTCRNKLCCNPAHLKLASSPSGGRTGEDILNELSQMKTETKTGIKN